MKDRIVDHGNGKGDKPRTPLNDQWRKNYDAINWGKKPKRKKSTT